MGYLKAATAVASILAVCGACGSEGEQADTPDGGLRTWRYDLEARAWAQVREH